jgi:hypothetical protein
MSARTSAARSTSPSLPAARSRAPGFASSYHEDQFCQVHGEDSSYNVSERNLQSGAAGLLPPGDGLLQRLRTSVLPPSPVFAQTPIGC